ncbi:YjcZ family sporulation protein [Virgibacillus sp. LDC1]|nr:MULTISPECIES: YjcZ family sporulation protein [Paenibacillus]MCV4231908.1 YjcZ family sporulation protein [Virgibacillus sp. LDC1]MEC0202928.1 YjcZ family sporulation protein [Paenibacillus lautus]MEC0256191.1 YjcZ family sporulation protein [Paenibacillus lautus]MEC0310478.1 YjcZ family sporulation protein [Paenibacillus lautus]
MSGYEGSGYGSSLGVILVLFILLVIILRTWGF